MMRVGLVLKWALAPRGARRVIRKPDGRPRSDAALGRALSSDRARHAVESDLPLRGGVDRLGGLGGGSAPAVARLVLERLGVARGEREPMSLLVQGRRRAGRGMTENQARHVLGREAHPRVVGVR